MNFKIALKFFRCSMRFFAVGTKLKFISYQHSNGEVSYGKSLEILEIRVKEKTDSKLISVNRYYSHPIFIAVSIDEYVLKAERFPLLVKVEGTIGKCRHRLLKKHRQWEDYAVAGILCLAFSIGMSPNRLSSRIQQ